MKPITNILLIIYIISYTFLPIFDVAFEGAWTGFHYTSYAITDSQDLGKQIFSLMPFIAAFAGISFNCMKNRYWGIVVAVMICLGLYFHLDAKDLVLIEQPEFYGIKGLGVGFHVCCVALLLAFVSAIVSVLPFKFNKMHARETMTKKQPGDGVNE